MQVKSKKVYSIVCPSSKCECQRSGNSNVPQHNFDKNCFIIFFVFLPQYKKYKGETAEVATNLTVSFEIS